MLNDLSKHVLMIGIDYKNPRGGIASVLAIYATLFPQLNFIRSSVAGTRFQKMLIALGCYCRLLWTFCFNKNIKIVHIHVSSDASFWRKRIVIYLAKRWNKRIVFHCHSGRFKEFRSKNIIAVDYTLQMCDVIVALSEEWKDYFQSIGCKNVVIIHNVIDVPMHIDVNRKDKIIHILFLGLISHNKGVYDIVKVIATHQQEWRNKVIFHVGGNGETDILQSQLKQNGIEDIVKFEGWVSNHKKILLLNQADIYILPSYKEGVPISILEAMSYKIPIITTPVGGIPSIVVDGVNGLIVKPGDCDAMYEALNKLINDPLLCKKMGEEGFQKSRAYFPNIVEKQLEELYMNLI